MLHVAHDEPVPARADFARVLVVDRGDMKAALFEAVVLNERAAHAPCPHQDDAVAAFEAEDVADAAGELGDRVAEAPFAEGAEEGQIFADLCGCGTAEPGQLAGRDRRGFGLLEKSEVDGQPADRAIGNLPHCELFHNGGPRRKSRFAGPYERAHDATADLAPQDIIDAGVGEFVDARGFHGDLDEAGIAPRQPTSATANRPPGFRTRNASLRTRRLSAERLMTQFEMMTSMDSEGSGMFSISPFRNSTLVAPAFA